jgi:hypothetical protein
MPTALLEEFSLSMARFFISIVTVIAIHCMAACRAFIENVESTAYDLRY